MLSNSVQLISCFIIHSLSSSCVLIVRVHSCLCSFSLYLVKALLARKLYVVWLVHFLVWLVHFLLYFLRLLNILSLVLYPGEDYQLVHILYVLPLQSIHYWDWGCSLSAVREMKVHQKCFFYYYYTQHLCLIWHNTLVHGTILMPPQVEVKVWGLGISRVS